MNIKAWASQLSNENLTITCGVLALISIYLLWKAGCHFFSGGYVSCETLLTNSELNFFRQLERHIPQSYIINSKVRLADIAKPKGSSRKLHYKVQAKHIDFIISERKTSKILCAIELDDSSHLSKGAFKRDGEKNYALRSANVPLVRIKNARKYPAKMFEPIVERLSITPLVRKAGNHKCPRCPNGNMEAIAMKWPNKGNSFHFCTSCGFRSKPEKT